ncbi:DUF881 domain-containing protein [Clostridium sp.]|uniref:DUF881 domain-containing protein n=1 Tax=Clostridium sp. TaxID=1506 RepID=UPI0026390AD6|nr:DUF881 domain-containing protein [Clostridium sp.]
MKNIKSKIFILLACIIIGFLISNNITVNKNRTNVSLNALEYKNAVDQRNKLYNEIDIIKSNNIDLRYNINKYKANDPEANKRLVEEMRKNLIDYGALSGTMNVTGRGVVLRVKDGVYDKVLDTNDDIMRKLLHEDDMALILNEIRNTSAEAIAIEDHRILPSTGVSCHVAFIGFEDETKESGPFNIYIIGDPEEIKASLFSENGHIQNLILREIKVDIEIREEITITKTNQITDAKYMERTEGN